MYANGWYASYITAAQKAGIVQGQDNGIFGVGKNVSRQDVAVMIYRAISATGKTLPSTREYADFTDDAQISDYAKDAVKALYSAGAINGMGDGTFGANEVCTRAQLSQILYGILELL